MNKSYEGHVRTRNALPIGGYGTPLAAWCGVCNVQTTGRFWSVPSDQGQSSNQNSRFTRSETYPSQILRCEHRIFFILYISYLIGIPEQPDVEIRETNPPGGGHACGPPGAER